MDYFQVLVIGGGTIGWILWVMSFIMVALAIHNYMIVRRVNILPDTVRDQLNELFTAKQYREAIDLTAENGDFLSFIVNSSLKDAPYGFSAMERAMEEAAEERTTKMLRGLEWLNLMGQIGPMLGLLGTVWGMIMAFFKIVEAGTPNPADLAQSIGIALVTTLLGLTLSIPAMSLYSILRTRIDAMTSESFKTAQEMIAGFRPKAKRQ
jgi:biopolymer transport protein ExbB